MADLEQWVLDGLALNDATFVLESISDPPAQKKPEWVSGADGDGALLGRKPTHENKVIEMRVRVAQQATQDLAQAKITQVLDKLQECAQHAYGLPLAWTPAMSTLAAGTYRCLLGEITDLPKDWQDSGWFVRSPVLTVRLTCLPFFEGAEYLVGAVTSADPMQTLELAGVTGDVPALGRLAVTDAASQSRRYVAWGLESRWYPTSAPPSLIVDSAAMTTTGFAGVAATRSGAYSGATNNVISATLQPQAQAICGLGNLLHVGSFRPHLRFYASATTIAVRLTFQALDGPLRSLSYRVPALVGWNYVDLGLVSIPKAGLGSQRWTGRLEAYSTATGGETLDVDVMLLVPAEAFGRVRGVVVRLAPVLSGYDYFTGMVAGASLGGRVAPAGGTWATSGSTGDFLTSEDALPGGVQRSTINNGGAERVAILGPTMTDTEAGVSVQWDRNDVNFKMGLRARNDGVRYASLFLDPRAAQLTLRLNATGTPVSRSATVTVANKTWYQLRLVVYASGLMIGALLDTNGAILQELRIVDASLSTGNIMAGGTVGFTDLNDSATAVRRNYDDFFRAVPAPEQIAVHEGQSIEFRSDSTVREDVTGTYAGPPPEYVGSRFLVPQAGGPGRKSRVAVVARRNDVVTAADDNIADSTQVQVYATPRFLAVPR